MRIDFNNLLTIAEISGNHGHSFQNAARLIDCCFKGGFNAVKLQTFDASLLAVDGDGDDYKVIDKNSPWNGRTLKSLYEESTLSWDIQKKIFMKYLSKKKLIFSSVFDKKSIDFVSKLNCPFYKIASFESCDAFLLDEVSKTKKPIIISTGNTNKEEIDFTINFLKKRKVKQIAILICVSDYPALLENYDLSKLKYFKERYNVAVGVSDHTVGNELAIAAVAAGATIIEKHVKLDSDNDSIDSHFSLSNKNFQKFNKLCRGASVSISNNNFKKFKKNERKYRKSLYFSKDLKKNTVIKKEHLKSSRPFQGVSSQFFFDIIGKVLKKNVKTDQPVNKNYFYN
jgi:N-acetylneuraminate synthase